MSNHTFAKPVPATFWDFPNSESVPSSGKPSGFSPRLNRKILSLLKKIILNYFDHPLHQILGGYGDTGHIFTADVY